MDLVGISSAVQSITGLVSKWIPDKTQEEQNQFILELTKVQADIAATQGQLDIDKTEAANPSVFTSGWRPFIGWTCGSAFATQFVVGPMGTWIGRMLGHDIQFPQLDLGTMMPVLLGMLGLGGMRTWEKFKGVSK